MNADETGTPNNVSNTVECRICGKHHKPIRAFEDERGYFVCSLICLYKDVYLALNGKLPEDTAVSRMEEMVSLELYWKRK